MSIDIDRLNRIKAAAADDNIARLAEVGISVVDPKSPARANAGDLPTTTPATPAKPRLITVADALDELAVIASKPVYPTPFATLNDALGFGGMLGGQTYDVVSQTGRGKTSWCGHVATHHARSGGDVVIAIYEAFAGYNVARMAAGAIGVRSNEIIRDPAKHASAVLEAIPRTVYFLERPTLATLREETDRLAQRRGAAPLVIADYLQKIADGIQAGQARPDARLATSQASAGLLEIAEFTGAAVLVVSAMSRFNGRRAAEDPRTMAPFELVDVAKESGAVEYDSAGLIVLNLSDDYDNSGQDRIATWTVAKARFGTEQHIDARFRGATGEWWDRGRVEVESPKQEELRDRIREALATPAATKTEIVKRSKRGKGAVMAEITAMVAAGEVVETAFGYSLPEPRK